MFFGSHAVQNLVPEEDAKWLFDAYAWCLAHFGRDVFFDETVLVVPDNLHFPGRSENAADMAELIFDHVRRYAGMRHWPLRVAATDICSVATPSSLEIRGALRGSGGLAHADEGRGNSVTLAYDPDLVGNPEALIASFAHALARYLGQTAPEPPPGGTVYWPQATEVLAVFLGFGLMFANSAFEAPTRSCGSCGGAQAQRRSFLTQYESTYALALFTVLKAIATKDVTRHLKKPLRPFFRKCVKEILGKQQQLARLRAVPGALPTGGAADMVTLTS